MTFRTGYCRIIHNATATEKATPTVHPDEIIPNKNKKEMGRD